jgi:hypothetical protein
MKAKIMPLRGKYYGTEIKIFDEDGTDEIKLWDSGDFIPSERELKACGLTLKQWVDNEEVALDDGKTLAKAKDILEICDSHFESDLTYKRALKIVTAINLYMGEQK